ncbi:UvrD-helicase domain-containing protein [Candidatus Poriferisodalis sp.]|uniref:UvrD-helicase domain-containing protein n=1 Tax=Candidatus Poriferisodalis sp. TaxID=3101277 RepID=UPI003B02B506
MSLRSLRLSDLHREAAAARALHKIVFETFGHCTSLELAKLVANATENITSDDFPEAVRLDSQFLELRRILTRTEWQLLPLTAQQLREGIRPHFAVDEKRVREVERKRRNEQRRRQERQRERDRELEFLERKAVAEARLKEARRSEIETACTEAFERDFLGADASCVTLLKPGVYEEDDYRQDKARFVRNWARQQLGLDLDDEQAAAVGAVAGNVLVTARAGSGKTRVLTTRAIFLQQHCGVPPSQIMLLAFNRAAAAEMQNRLRDQLGDSIPHVMTFHALGHALAPPQKEGKRLLYDDRDDGKLHLTEVVQQVIDEFVRDDQWHGRIRDLMLAHFEADWGRIESGGYHLSGDEFIRFRRSLTHETLNGERVRNFGQQAIANVLLEHDIPYRFDHGFDWSGRRLRADFFIRVSHENSIYIRYIDAADRRPRDDDEWTLLRESIESGVFKGRLLEITQEELLGLGAAGFVSHLCARLTEYGASPSPIGRDELWQKIKDRAVDDFSKAMEQFVGRCRQRNWSPSDLNMEIIRHETLPGASHSELEFYQIGAAVYSEYLQRLERDRREDFNGLMIKAAEAVDAGRLRFARKGYSGSVLDLRYVHIDEYQDFSRSFHNLTQAMRRHNPRLETFSVGDDWQAINGFAGSDLQYFRNFGTHFSPAMSRTISRNYRSARRIVEASNLLLGTEDTQARPVHADEGRVYVCDLESFRPLPSERKGREDSGISTTSEGFEMAIGRLAYHAAQQGSVVLLNRTRNPDVIPGGKLSPALKTLRETLPRELQERVAISTAHKYKGLEQDTVIILDAVANHYPLIHPHWMFGRIFGDTLDTIAQDERRLFYVALTRAKKSLYICTQGSKRSPFLVNIVRSPSVEQLDWHSLVPIPRDGPELCAIRVHNSYDAHKILKADGFTFMGAEAWKDRHWLKVMRRHEVTVDWIRDAPWNDGHVVIKIFDAAGDLVWSSETGDLSDWDAAKTLGS